MDIEDRNNDMKSEADAFENTEGEKKLNWKKELLDWVIAIMLAVIVALVIRNFVFTLVKVQGASMEPSLHQDDRLFVNRFFYTPKRGDVVIFTPATDPNRPYVKRVIATEGDTVYIDYDAGNVYVNGALLDEPYIKEKTKHTGAYIRGLEAKGVYGPESPIVVPVGHIFAMGDNRNNSKDSRELGPIPIDEIMGGAVFRFWPFKDAGTMHSDAKEISMIDADVPVCA